MQACLRQGDARVGWKWEAGKGQAGACKGGSGGSTLVSEDSTDTWPLPSLSGGPMVQPQKQGFTQRVPHALTFVLGSGLSAGEQRLDSLSH